MSMDDRSGGSYRLDHEADQRQTTGPEMVRLEEEGRGDATIYTPPTATTPDDSPIAASGSPHPPHLQLSFAGAPDDGCCATPVLHQRQEEALRIESNVENNNHQQQMQRQGIFLPPRDNLMVISAPTTFTRVEELVHRVMLYLEPKERSVFASVNKRYRRIAYNKRLIAAAEDVHEAKAEVKELESEPEATDNSFNLPVVILFQVISAIAALLSICALADTGSLPYGSIAGLVSISGVVGIGAFILMCVATNYKNGKCCGANCINCFFIFSLFLVVLPLAILSNMYLAAYRYVSEPPFVPECSNTPVGEWTYPYTVRFADPSGWVIESAGKRFMLSALGNDAPDWTFWGYKATYTVTQKTYDLCKSNDVGRTTKVVLILNHKMAEGFQASQNYPAVLWSVYFAESFEDRVSRRYRFMYWRADSPYGPDLGIHGSGGVYAPLIMPRESEPVASTSDALLSFGLCFGAIWLFIIAVPLLFGFGHLQTFYHRRRMKVLRSVIEDAEQEREMHKSETEAERERFDETHWQYMRRRK